MLKKVYFLAGISLILSGCEGQKEHWGRGVDTPWKTQVRRLTSHAEISFSARSHTLGSSQKKKIYELFAQAKPDMRIYARLQAAQAVDPNVRNVMKTRLVELKKFLMKSGLKENDIEIFYLEPVGNLKGAERNTILVMLDQYKAVPPTCPGLSVVDSNTPPHGEEQFGCITERNFAQMLADPRDLYKVYAPAEGDGPYQIEAIKRYRTDKVKELKIEKIEKKN